MPPYHLVCAIDNNDFSSGRVDVNEPSIKVIKKFETLDRAMGDSEPFVEKYNKDRDEGGRASGCMLFEGKMLKEL
jgi:hypothetical protein